MAVSDHTGQAWLQGFHDVGLAVFNMSADDLMEIKVRALGNSATDVCSVVSVRTTILPGIPQSYPSRVTPLSTLSAVRNSTRGKINREYDTESRGSSL
jgi:hypothetical protein